MTPIQPVSELYRNSLKNREYAKEAPQNFDSERVTIAERQGASENQNFEAAESRKRSTDGPFSRGADERSESARREPTQAETDSSGCFGIAPVQPPTVLKRALLVALTALMAVGFVLATFLNASWYVPIIFFTLTLAFCFPLTLRVDTQRERINKLN